MSASHEEILTHSYPVCRAQLKADQWGRVLDLFKNDPKPERFPDNLKRGAGKLGLPAHLPDLVKLENGVYKVRTERKEAVSVDSLMVNPTLQLIKLQWKGLASLLNEPSSGSSDILENAEGYAIIWKDLETGRVRTAEATVEDLLVLKLMVEDAAPIDIGRANGLPLQALDAMMDRAVHRGILLQPSSRIRRDPVAFGAGPAANDLYMVSPSFAVQWHITQACDLHCKHCYDRSDRSPLTRERAFKVLEDLRTFCRSRYVKGHVTFTGGNPLLYPHFLELYARAVEMGFGVAILGNPAPREKIEQIIAIQKPAFFQTSLEGLAEHNDHIRGAGHFDRVMAFLDSLRQLEVESIIMLTLTRENMDQVLPLAETLKDLADGFFFNRLSSVGEGANLTLPSKEAFAAFLYQYREAARRNPRLGLKDNLFNIVLDRRGEDLFDGCSGYGCGAAFNFVAILSDGAVHACRKFPSPLGNIFENKLSDIYESPLARKYRTGCNACRSCRLRPVCGGCLAIAHSHGLDIFEERDPYCFLSEPGNDFPDGRQDQPVMFPADGNHANVRRI
jgi:selenobiotic family peptide radical SAM maturase